MTFLQLCQRLRLETAYAESGPSAVTSQTGAHLRNVNWVAEAWVELQNRYSNWRWLRAKFTFDTTASQDSYAYGVIDDVATSAVITRFRRWQITDPQNPVKCYLTSSGSGTGYWLTYVSWEYFRTIYQIGSQPEGAPAHIAITPDNKLILGPTPNGIYTIEGEYQRSAQILAADGDTPELPSDYHMLIVYRAMEDFALFENAAEIMNRAQMKSRRILRQLEDDQMPPMRTAGPMA